MNKNVIIRVASLTGILCIEAAICVLSDWHQRIQPVVYRAHVVSAVFPGAPYGGRQ